MVIHLSNIEQVDVYDNGNSQYSGSDSGDCNLADIIAVYKQSERFYIVGIEIKEWDKRVNPKMAMEYLETYRGTCEYFVFAQYQVGIQKIIRPTKKIK